MVVSSFISFYLEFSTLDFPWGGGTRQGTWRWGGRLWCRAQNRKRLLEPLFSGFLHGQLIQLPVNWLFVPCCPGRKRAHHPRQQSWPQEPRTCMGALSLALLLYRATSELLRQENGKKAQAGIQHPAGSRQSPSWGTGRRRRRPEEGGPAGHTDFIQ